MLFLLLRGEVLPATFFKLTRVVKLRLQVQSCRQLRNSKVLTENGRQRTHTPLGGLTKERNNNRVRDRPRMGFICRVYVRQHGLERSLSKSASLVASRCSCGLTRIVVEAIIFLFCSRIKRSV